MSKKKRIVEVEEVKFVQVTDDWGPCFYGNTVQVKLRKVCPMDGGPTYVVLSAWGADDVGVEMSYASEMTELVDARYDHWEKYIFNRIVDGVSKEWFFEHGFVPA